MDEKLILCIKISQKEWIDKLQEGSAWFGAIDNFIVQAEKSDNNEQGDRYEGVFARTRKDSSIVCQYQQELGDDLEVIDAGEYCFLRRKSSRKACVFCMYGVKNTDVSIIELLDNGDRTPMGKFRYYINQKMYTGFLQDGKGTSEVAGFYCSSGHIIDEIEKSLNKGQYKWSRKMIHYDIDISKDFLIEPKPDYPELFHKRCDLQYQHEVRFLVLDAEYNGRGIAIPYSPISVNSGNIALGEIYIEGTAKLEAIDD